MKTFNEEQLSNDMTTNSTVHENADLRTPAAFEGTMPTPANDGGEPYYIARFANYTDAKNVYDAIIEHNAEEAVMVSRIHNNEDHFYDDLGSLESDIKKDEIHCDLIALGVRAASPEDTERLTRLFNANHVVSTNQ